MSSAKVINPVSTAGRWSIRQSAPRNLDDARREKTHDFNLDYLKEIRYGILMAVRINDKSI